jgi:hypothetical protein
LCDFFIQVSDGVAGLGAFGSEVFGERFVFGSQLGDFALGGDGRGLGIGELALGITEFEHRVFEGFSEFRGRILLSGMNRGKESDEETESSEARK